MSASDITQIKYWNRICYVDIEMRNKKMKRFGIPDDGSSSFDIKFNVQKFVSNTVVEFSVSITGLSVATINELTVWNTAEAYKKRRKIILYAGYKDGGISSPIAQGFIVNAIPTPPPNLTLNMKCIGNQSTYSIVDSPVVLRDKTIQEIAQFVADTLKMKLKWNVEKAKQDKVRAYTIEGSINQIFEKLKNSFDVVFQIRADCLYVYDKAFYERSGGRNKPHVADMEHGLLALGNITLKGADITMRLNDKYRVTDFVRLESKLIPSGSGMYCISEIIHHGQLRGNDWVTELHMIRPAK